MLHIKLTLSILQSVVAAERTLVSFCIRCEVDDLSQASGIRHQESKEKNRVFEKAVMGTSDCRAAGFCYACGLHTLQSD